MLRAAPAHFETFGYVVLRDAFQPDALRRELQGVRGSGTASLIETGTTSFRYAPMMSAHTPHSLALLDQLEPVAVELLGRSVLPVRAKGVRYVGGTSWHSDSTRPLSNVGFLAYLEPLTSENGALRVLPGSHHAAYAEGVRSFLAAAGDVTVDTLPGVPLATSPGDLIAFDERLFHASSGGTERLQWRVDYIAAPSNHREQREARAYFAELFAPDWDGGYDPERSPSYGADWLASRRPSVEPLRRLGVYDLARAQEDFMRARRRSLA